MAEPTVKRGSDQFFTTLYEGNGGGQKVGRFVPFTDNGTITNSVIFNDGDEPELSRTPSGAGNRDIFTFSFWIKRCTVGSLQLIYQQGADVNNCTQFSFDSSDRIQYQQVDGGGNTDSLVSNRTFEDTTKFYHIVLAVDTTQSTEAHRVRIYVDGDEITSWSTANYPSQNVDTDMNTTTEFSIGRQLGATSAYSPDCYFAEMNFVDGTQYTPSTFGVTDTSTGRWIPKSLSGITYGTNGFRLTFASAAALGTDTSGQSNNFTPNNLSTTDQTTDTPSQNHCVLSNSLSRGSVSLSEGGLKLQSSSSNYACCATTMQFSETDSQGYYFETKVTGSTRSSTGLLIMRATVNVTGLSSDQQHAGCFGILARGGGGSNQYWFTVNGSYDGTTGVAHGANDVLQVAFKEGKVWFGINNTYLLSGNPATGANPTFSNIAGEDFRFLICTYSNYDILECNFGQKTYAHTAPTGFVALQQDNRPETEKGITDLVWIKNRDSTDNWQVYDSTRGPRLDLSVDTTDHQSTTADGLQRFLKGGFQIEDDVSVNTSGESYIAYNWIANGGTEVSNGNGSVTSNVQANQDAGFSIVRYTGTGSALTVGHGLSQAPEWIVARPITQTGSYHWSVYLKYMGGGDPDYYQSINQNISDTSNANVWGDAPTSTVVHCGSSMPNGAHEVIMYCWHSVKGFSKFGAFNGNASATEGPYIHCGFKPAWVLFKAHNAASWYLHDAARNPTNIGEKRTFFPDTSAAEDNNSGRDVDFLAGGFVVRQESGYGYNYSGTRTHYMAFAQHPFVGSGSKSPVTAV